MKLKSMQRIRPKHQQNERRKRQRNIAETQNSAEKHDIIPFDLDRRNENELHYISLRRRSLT